MIKKVVLLLLMSFLILAAPLIISFGQLLFSDAKIVPVYLTHYYLARVNTGEDVRRLLIDYLTGQGYTLVEDSREHMVFEKDGEKKNVLPTDVKDVIRDGKLASDFHLPQ